MQFLDLPDDVLNLICRQARHTLQNVFNHRIHQLCCDAGTDLVLYRIPDPFISKRPFLKSLDVPILSPKLWNILASSLIYLEKISCSVFSPTSSSLSAIATIPSLLQLEVRFECIAAKDLYYYCPNLQSLTSPTIPLPDQLPHLQSFTIFPTLPVPRTLDVPLAEFLLSRIQHPCFTSLTKGYSGSAEVNAALETLDPQLVIADLPRAHVQLDLMCHRPIKTVVALEQLSRKGSTIRQLHFDMRSDVSLLSERLDTLFVHLNMLHLYLDNDPLTAQSWDTLSRLPLTFLTLDTPYRLCQHLGTADVSFPLLQRLVIDTYHEESDLFPAVASFAKMPALTSLTTNIAIGGQTVLASCPQLQELVLANTAPEYLSEFIVCTSLTSLTFSCIRRGDTQLAMSVQPWVDELVKFSNLRSLSISRALIRSAPLGQLLQALPLCHLKISYSLMSAECFDTLARHGAHLIELLLHQNVGCADEEDAIMRMVDILSHQSLAFCHIDAVMKEKLFVRHGTMGNGAILAIERSRIFASEQVKVVDDNSVNDEGM